MTEKLRAYVERFNREDEETVVQKIPNAKACKWLEENIPRVELPDAVLEEIYYFRCGRSSLL